MEQCEKGAFQLSKMRKINVTWNIKMKVVIYDFLSAGFSIIKDYTYHSGKYVKKKTITKISIEMKENFEKFP